ncbi:unnamed protein product [Prunus armeniaca]|uniref:Uncharacterized protein n=1 Tax=Prunus armeniaca TaxID=36596 RepID=A0A6J5XSE8_PRUAR|nr:unnamed protein product [Prunus armeniaca]CAB4316659.1 unnamed protein product [Prunus armeniaca]
MSNPTPPPIFPVSTTSDLSGLNHLHNHRNLSRLRPIPSPDRHPSLPHLPQPHLGKSPQRPLPAPPVVGAL